MSSVATLDKQQKLKILVFSPNSIKIEANDVSTPTTSTCLKTVVIK